jgi:WD40 repeat protein
VEAGNPDLRGFEWHYLRRLCDYELLNRWETGLPIECLAYSPDGKTIATGHGYSSHRGFELRPGVVQVRDAETGRLLWKPSEAHRGPVFDLTFSPDGHRIASAGADRTAKVWDADSGRLLHSLGGHPFEVNAVAFSPDGKWIATASGGRYPQGYGPEYEAPGAVTVWDAATGQVVWPRTNRSGAVIGVAFSPDGSRLAWGGFTDLYFSDPASGRPLGRYPTIVGCPRGFSSDGRWLVTCMEGGFGLWDLSSSPATVRHINEYRMRQETGDILGVKIGSA